MTHDDIEALKNTLQEKEDYIRVLEDTNAMYDNLVEYHRTELIRKNTKIEKITNERNIIQEHSLLKKNELNIARKIQLSILPDTYPKNPHIHFHTMFKSMEELCGDYYDILSVREPNIIGIFQSDVSGHGAPAALITAMLKILLIKAGEDKFEPVCLLGDINKSLAALALDYFITAFYGVYDTTTRILRYASAAHPPPLVIRRGKLIKLEGDRKLLGIYNDVALEEKSITLEKEDRIIFYTDGITEAINNKKVPFEKQFEETMKISTGLALEELIKTIYSNLVEHNGSENFEDDICLIGMDVTG